MKQNLMVFMHPRILRDSRLADQYTGEKYSYIRSEQLERKRKGQVLMIDELPTLPELKLRHGAPAGATSRPSDERTQPGTDADAASNR
jgi:hypothetical protein